MVAQAKQARPQLTSMPGGGRKGNATAMRARGPDPTQFPRPASDKVDLTKVATDMSALRQIRVTHIDNYVIKAHALYHQLDPTTPYVTVGDDRSSQALTQYTHPLIASFVNKGIPYLLSKGVSVHVSATDNPGSSQLDCGWASATVQFTWRWNEYRAPGINSKRRRLKMIMLEGGYAAQYNYLTPGLADEQNNGFPVIYHLQSLLDIEFVRDASGILRKVMCGKRRIAGELPDKYLAKAGYQDADPATELDVYEVWTRWQHGVAIGTTIVKPMTDHGLMDRNGSPLCPWIIKLHDPEEFIKGDTSPVSTGMTPVKVIVGNPVVKDLIKTCEMLSWYLTLVRAMAADVAFADRLIKGDYEYDPLRRIFMMEDTPEANVTYVNGTNQIGAVLQVAGFLDSLMEMGAAGKNLLSGQPLGQSGVAVGMETALPKAKLEDAQVTLEEGLAEEAMLQLALICSNCEPTTAQKYQAAFNRPLTDNMRMLAMHPRYNPDPAEPDRQPGDMTSPFTDGNWLPYSEQITGDKTVQLTRLNFAHIRFIDVSCRPYENLSREAKMAQGNVFLQQGPNAPIDEEEILGTWFDMDDPARAIKRRNLSRLTNNPNLPFQDMDAIREWALSQMSTSRNPMQLQNLIEQIDQTYEQQMIQLAMKRLQQASTPQQSATGQPGGPPASGGPGTTGPMGSPASSPGSPGGPPQNPGGPGGQMPPMPQGGMSPQNPMQQQAPSQFGPNPGGIGQPMAMPGGR